MPIIKLLPTTIPLSVPSKDIPSAVVVIGPNGFLIMLFVVTTLPPPIDPVNDWANSILWSPGLRLTSKV